MPKVLVSLPDELLELIDAEAQRQHLSRSSWLAAAAHRELDRRDPAAMRAAIARSERRFRNAGAFESADLVRAERDRLR